MNELKNQRTPGKDNLTKELLFKGKDKLIRALKIFSNKCLETGKIVYEWKESTTILLHKWLTRSIELQAYHTLISCVEAFVENINKKIK